MFKSYRWIDDVNKMFHKRSMYTGVGNIQSLTWIWQKIRYIGAFLGECEAYDLPSDCRRYICPRNRKVYISPGNRKVYISPDDRNRTRVYLGKAADVVLLQMVYRNFDYIFSS